MTGVMVVCSLVPLMCYVIRGWLGIVGSWCSVGMVRSHGYVVVVWLAWCGGVVMWLCGGLVLCRCGYVMMTLCLHGALLNGGVWR